MFHENILKICYFISYFDKKKKSYFESHTGLEQHKGDDRRNFGWTVPLRLSSLTD